jgi:hypothetical protein
MVAHAIRRSLKLRQALDQALPQRPLRVDRKVLIDAIVERVETWKGINSELALRAGRGVGPVPRKSQAKTPLQRLTKINDDLKKALEKAGGALNRLGVDDDIERIRARNASLGIDPKRGPLRGKSAAVDLYLTAWRAIDDLRGWDRMHRRGRGTPRAFSAELTEHLQDLCRKRAGLSQYEFADVLAAVGHAEGIAGLAVDTLRKRKQRGTK